MVRMACGGAISQKHGATKETQLGMHSYRGSEPSTREVALTRARAQGMDVMREIILLPQAPAEEAQ